jgi:hypothetical protein
MFPVLIVENGLPASQTRLLQTFILWLDRHRGFGFLLSEQAFDLLKKVQTAILHLL